MATFELPVLSENSVRLGFASCGGIIAGLGRCLRPALARMFVVDLFRSRWRLKAENLFLRYQLAIALRRVPPRPSTALARIAMKASAIGNRSQNKVPSFGDEGSR